MPAMLIKTLLIALVLPVLSAAAVQPSAAPDRSVPETMNLSSWRPDSPEGLIAGGTQTVTIVNTSAEALRGITFTLEVPPCDCTLASVSTKDGQVTRGVWRLAELPSGATASLDVVYESGS
jgi:hypothetical protein